MRQDICLERNSILGLRLFAKARGIGEDVAQTIYELEFNRLSAHARVRRFVPLLAEKHVKAVLRMATPGRGASQ